MNKNNEIAVKLVFPPFWTVTQPYLSVSSLNAYLCKMGVDSKQIDLNLECYDYILSAEFLKKCRKKLEMDNSDKQDEIGKSTDFIEYAIDNIDLYKNLFRSENALDIFTYNKCYKFMSMCLSIISKIYVDENISFDGYSTKKYSEEKSEDILKCITDVLDSKENSGLLGEILNRYVSRIVENIDVVGISVTGGNQIIPSFMLAAMIKKKNPCVKIVMGGNVITRLTEKLKELPEVFRVVDFFLYGEGEHSLYMLVNFLKGENNIGDVPNLLYLNEIGKVIKNQESYCLTINDLPTPLFNKEDITRYFSPMICMPMLTSRGCFWGKCSFCDHSYVYHEKYQRRKLELVIQDIEVFCKEYNCNIINFHDEAISPVELNELSQALKEKQLKIKWTSCARLDMSMSREILQQAAEAGLSVLFFGLESANQRVLQLMNKGTKIEKVQEVLHNSASAGIWNHTFFICGFPTETMSEFEETLTFIKENEAFIHSTGSSYFTLGSFCPIAENAEKYKVEIIEDKEFDFRFWHEFKNVLPTKSKWEYYETNMKKIVMGKFAQQSIQLCRDHWAMFKDSLFEREETETEEKEIKLLPSVFYEGKRQRLYVYTIYHNKLITIRFKIWFLEVMNLLVKPIQEKELYAKIGKKFQIPLSEVEVSVKEFLKILEKYNCI